MTSPQDDSRFCQADSTNCHRHGTGLGLHLHSGTLSCHAQPQHHKNRKGGVRKYMCYSIMFGLFNQ